MGHSEKNKDYKTEFEKLNSKNLTDFVNYESTLNYISDRETLICGRCGKEKHIDYFCGSDNSFLCEDCDKNVKEISLNKKVYK